MHCLLTAICLALVTSACAGAQTSPSVGPSITPLAAQPTIRAEQSTSPTPSAMPTAAAGRGLAVPGFATVTADQLMIRSDPGLAADPIVDGMMCIDNPDPDCARPILLGAESRYSDVYLFDGPIRADGHDWYLAAVEGEGILYWETIGWIAAGDDQDAWIVANDRACPAAPYELSEVAYPPLSPLTALHCLGGQQLTLRGYYPEPPPEEPGPQECSSEPAWLVCSFGWPLLRVAEGPWAGSTPDIALHIHPDVPEMPPRPGWIEVTGQFDHPAATECGDGQPQTTLSCRVQFVVISARAISEP